MGFLSPYFVHDVFVSYSHGDPLGRNDSPLKRWTIKLVSELIAEIHAIDTEFDNLDVWIDEHLDPTAKLSEELRKRVSSAGILIIIMSRRYLSSSWCKDELDWFRAQVKERSRDPDRIFVVRAQPTDETNWPDFLRDERGNSPLGFRFYDPQSQMPYGWHDVAENDKDFVRQLWTLQTALTKRLREFRSRQESRTTVSAAPVGSGGPPRVYLYARPEYASLRDEISSQFVAKGVTPLSPPTDAGQDLSDFTVESKKRIEAAKRCHAIVLVRGDDDDRFLDDILDIGIDERRRIEEARGTPLPCAILDRSGEGLPMDVAGYGIHRFDIGKGDWYGEFQAWLETVRSSGEPKKR
jgi:hypothetical protein